MNREKTYALSVQIRKFKIALGELMVVLLDVIGHTARIIKAHQSRAITAD